MSAELPIPIDVKQVHRTAIDDVNRWRGHCVELFARVEQELASALAALNAGKIPPALAAKMARLDEIVAPAGPSPNAKLEKTLTQLAPLAEHRNLVVHARSSVWVNDRSKWLWAYVFTPSGKGSCEQVGHWTEDEALKFKDELSRTAQSLCSQLRTLSEKRIT